MKIILTDAAEADLAGICAYYSARSGPAADRVLGTILRAINGLALFPLLGRPGEVPETRERLVTRYPFRIVYHIDEAHEVVEIWRVLHGARLIARKRGSPAGPLSRSSPRRRSDGGGWWRE